MQYNFVIIRTDRGGRYARKILRSIKWLNENKYPQHEFNIENYTISEFLSYGCEEILVNFDARRTIIHARCANPRTEWTIRLRELEEKGYKVVNSVDCIELTSNKLACSLHLQGKVNHPKSMEWNKNGTDFYKEILVNEILDSFQGDEFFIAKPITSLEQGANVKKIRLDHIGGDGWTYDEITEKIEEVPGSKIVVQEYVPYTALHRVIVIGGKALPYTFIDRPEWHTNDWKVSCCLNRTTMKLYQPEYLGQRADWAKLISLAEQTQKEVGGIINFIDIFETPDGFTNAEINTACSLNIHERLAKEANRPDWNIHARIAKELVKQLL
jgi:glutathione synthase/RimK-type ligase-like ATP-grasp enzyme